ncbi:MAG: ABC transporter ATP-binding protein, partial [Bacilli bacterium]|nr:ABC transporter ATP-binding protein [Bacilli bacterium]
MIKVRNLHKYFNKSKSNEIHAVNNVNFDFPAVGLVCLLGPSGCGKTTLLNIIGGLDKPTQGEIEIKGKTIPAYKAERWDTIRNRHFGYIFQNYYLLPDLTVYQNLEFVLKIINVSPEEIDKRIEYALTAVGMYKYRKRKPHQLSGGQQQRVAIARALVKSPNVVVADEP